MALIHSINSAGDYHLWRKFAEKERLYSLNTLISGFRIHEGQKSSDKIEYFREEGKMNSVEMILAKFKIFKIIDRFCAMRQKDLIIKVQDI